LRGWDIRQEKYDNIFEKAIKLKSNKFKKAILHVKHIKKQ
jgi:hypothetical protein